MFSGATAYARAFVDTDVIIQKNLGDACKSSGTTAVVAHIVQDMLHMGNVGDSRAILGTAREGVDGNAGALLSWKADGGSAGAQPTAYTVQFSDDGGMTWQVAIAHTGSADPRARIAQLMLGRAYLFRVASIGLAATGAYSAAATRRSAAAAAAATCRATAYTTCSARSQEGGRWWRL